MVVGRENGKHNLHILDGPYKERKHPIILTDQRWKFFLDGSHKHSHAGLVFVLNISLLTQDLRELFEIMLEGYHSGKLKSTGKFQTNWYAHALWGLYQAITKFFQMRLTENNLMQGARLVRPLTKYLDNMCKFSMYH